MEEGGGIEPLALHHPGFQDQLPAIQRHLPREGWRWVQGSNMRAANSDLGLASQYLTSRSTHRRFRLRYWTMKCAWAAILQHQQREQHMMKWIHITEAMPERFATVIAYTGADVEPAFFDGEDFISLDGTCDAGDAIAVTHWMPLPPPPVRHSANT